MELNAEHEVQFDYSKIKLLIAEDNEINRQVLSFILDKLSVKYDFALNGLEAVEKCRTTNYHIIFTDLNMPVMDGFEATRIIRKEMSWQPPVIAISAISFEEEIKDCYTAGMNDFLPKPFALDSLKMMLRKWSNEAGNSQVAA
jgi:CheY-like chemotaxis protein